MRILLIEDDQQTAEHVMFQLRANGYSVEHCRTGPEGEEKAGRGTYKALIVDRMLPGKDGLSVVRSLRREGLRTPVLFLTAMGSINDRVQGLEGGGDDYLTKPFAIPELLARLNAIMRRGIERPTTVKVGSLEMDLLRRTLKRDGKLIELQPQEFHLMEYLMLNAGRVVTRAMLLENVWNLNFTPSTNLIETHMSRLRAKIGCSGDKKLITTIRNLGYLVSGE